MNSALWAGRAVNIAGASAGRWRVSGRRMARRTYATEPSPPASRPPPPTATGENKPQTRAGTFYKSFGSPILKCFLGALFTYQVTYWAWMKLESVEIEKNYEDRIEDLKDDLRDAMIEKRRRGKQN